jgi:hypothetical protein
MRCDGSFDRVRIGDGRIVVVCVDVFRWCCATIREPAAMSPTDDLVPAVRHHPAGPVLPARSCELLMVGERTKCITAGSVAPYVGSAILSLRKSVEPRVVTPGPSGKVDPNSEVAADIRRLRSYVPRSHLGQLFAGSLSAKRSGMTVDVSSRVHHKATAAADAKAAKRSGGSSVRVLNKMLPGGGFAMLSQTKHAPSGCSSPRSSPG